MFRNVEQMPGVSLGISNLRDQEFTAMSDGTRKKYRISRTTRKNIQEFSPEPPWIVSRLSVGKFFRCVFRSLGARSLGFSEAMVFRFIFAPLARARYNTGLKVGI